MAGIKAVPGGTGMSAAGYDPDLFDNTWVNGTWKQRALDAEAKVHELKARLAAFEYETYGRRDL